MTLRLDSLPYATDRGQRTRARIGLLAVASDATIEHDFRLLLKDLSGVELYTARIPGGAADATADARTLSARIAPGLDLLLPGERLDAIALACGTTALVLGEDWIETLCQRVRPGVPVTMPVGAIRSALRACGVARVGILSPYRADYNVRLEQALSGAGIEVAVFGSFDEDRDPVIGSITANTVHHNVLALAESARMDGFLIAGTQLRVLAIIEGLERELGIPVIGTGQALIWQCLRVAGVAERIRGHGLLFGLPLQAQSTVTR